MSGLPLTPGLVSAFADAPDTFVYVFKIPVCRDDPEVPPLPQRRAPVSRPLGCTVHRPWVLELRYRMLLREVLLR